MKLLFVAFRHDPLQTANRQGADRQFLDAFQENGWETITLGPFNGELHLFEKIFRKLVKVLSGKAYLKYDLTNTFKAAKSVNTAIREDLPDIVFSLYPAPLVFYRGTPPVVFRTDATIKAVLQEAPQFLQISKLLRGLSLWVEKRAIKKSALIITHSEWSKRILQEDYKVDPVRILVVPNPSSLRIDPNSKDFFSQPIKSILDRSLKLLFIGQDPVRKGLGIALSVVEQLNKDGICSHLTVCGLSGQSTELISYSGKLQLNIPEHLSTYLAFLHESHFLLHPAIFDPSPRVTAEAAAFGTPTLTNDTGGLATSVKHGVSGIVLPKGSPPEAYVEVVEDLIQNPARYHTLCRSTRERYEQELNWQVVGVKINEVLTSLVNTGQKKN